MDFTGVRKSDRRTPQVNGRGTRRGKTVLRGGAVI